MKPIWTVKIKRVYEQVAANDGTRVLVDRLWPRGLTKERAKVNIWLKSVAPTDGLRRWFGHDVGHWEEFSRRYAAELADQKEGVEQLRDLAAAGNLTLLYGARDEVHNHARVLMEYVFASKPARRTRMRAPSVPQS
jgi:uncharacterized protein YeaO (DUF488 family)